MKQFAWILLLPPVVAAQPCSPPSTVTGHLHLSFRHAEDLDYKHTLVTATELSSNDRAELRRDVSALVRPFMKDNEIASEVQRLVSISRVKVADLNNDGIPEVLVQASNMKIGCGATGNCALWIFKKAGDHYKLLLDTRDKDGLGGIRKINIESSCTGGFHNLVLAADESASEKSFFVYVYQRNRYNLGACYSAHWDSWLGGTYHSLKKPIISSVNCSQ